MKHGQQKWKTQREASSNEPELAANPMVPKMSSFVHARTTEMEDREAYPNEPDIAATPRKVLK